MLELQKQILASRLPIRVNISPIQHTENKIIDIDGKIINDDSENESYKLDFSESNKWLAEK
jgi:hypothetical protein